MRLILLSSLFLFTACTGEWGDWMQTPKPDEDEQFFGKYYDQDGKSQKGLYSDDTSLKEDQQLYRPSTELYGTNSSSDLYGK